MAAGKEVPPCTDAPDLLEQRFGRAACGILPNSQLRMHFKDHVFRNHESIILAFIFLSGTIAICVAQQGSLSPDLKAAALRDAACTSVGDASLSDPPWMLCRSVPVAATLGR